MKRANLILFSLFFIATMLLALVLPIWYAYVLAILLLSLLFSTAETRAFWLGFSSVFMAWLILTLVFDLKNDSILSQRIAVLFKLPSKWLLMVLSAFIGALLGGIASWLGKNLKRSFGGIK